MTALGDLAGYRMAVAAMVSGSRTGGEALIAREWYGLARRIPKIMES